MATSGAFNTSSVGSFYFTFEWYRTRYDSTSNVNYIHYTLTAHNTAGSYRTVYLKNLYVNGSQVHYSTGGVACYNGTVVASGDMTIANYSSEGDGRFSASFEAGVGTTSGSNCSGSGSWDLDRIPRYAEINNAYVESTTLTSATIRYSVSRNAHIYCSVDGQAWGNPRVSNTTSGTFTITGLSPNVNHSFAILSRATDSGLDRVSGTFYGKTKDIVRITSVDNTNFGEVVNIKFSNLGNGTGKLIVKVGNIQICTRENLTATYQLEFGKEELSTLVSQFKSNEIEVSYIAMTNDTYSSTTKATITIQSNIYKKRDGVWVKSKLYKKETNWKITKLFYKVDGTWRNTQ